MPAVPGAIADPGIVDVSDRIASRFPWVGAVPERGAVEGLPVTFECLDGLEAGYILKRLEERAQKCSAGWVVPR
jgi:hypothetical protein